MTERVAVIGARKHPRLDLVREYVAALPAGTVVVSGGAEGVDVAAVAEAIRQSLDVYVYWPMRRDARVDYGGLDIDGDYTGPVECLQQIVNANTREALLYRNTLIALACTRMVCFPDGTRGGSWDACDQARRFRRPVELRWADGRVEPYTGRGARR